MTSSTPNRNSNNTNGDGTSSIITQHSTGGLTNFSIEAIIGAKQPHVNQHTSKSVSPRKVRPKNFLCPACKMAFSNNGQLKNHARIHTGERPFKCQYQGCNKTFTRNEELTRHKLIHSGFRPHICSTCNKRFGRKDHLKKHMKTHENKRFRQLRKTQSTTRAHQDPFPIHSIGSSNSAVQQQIPTSDHQLPQPTRGRFFPHHLGPQPQLPSHVLPPPTPDQSRLIPRQIQIQMGLRPSPRLVKGEPPSTSVPITISSDFNPLSPGAITSTATSNVVLQQALYAQMVSMNSQQPLMSPSVQHLASEYWSRWYNLMGILPISGQYTPQYH